MDLQQVQRHVAEDDSTSCCWKTSVYFPRPSLLKSSGRSEPFSDALRLQPLLPVTEEMQSM